ncbi:cytochrome c [Phenylobacterium sp.]|uniref:c-type cytochrome n=1 Tax=Phenylobacterium sp. TaxID=1871053 RepID=UPI002F3F6C00
MAGIWRGRLAVTAAALGLGLAVAAGGALAQSAGADAVKARQANFKQLGGAFKTINDQLKAGAPDMAAIKAAASRMQALAARAPDWFPAGSGPEAGVKTGAKPEIWSDAAGFATAARGLQAATASLSAAANGGDPAAVRAQVAATGAACKACHDKYRAKSS